MKLRLRVKYPEEYRSLLKLSIRIAGRFQKTLLILLFFVVLSTLGSLLLPLLHRAIIDDAIMGKDLPLLQLYLLYYLIFIVTISALNIWREYVYTSFSNRLFHQMRLVLFYKALTARYTLLEEVSDGDLLSIILEDSKAIRNFIIEVVMPYFTSIITSLIALYIMFAFSPKIALMSLLFIPAYFLFYSFCNKFVRSFAARLRETIGDIYTCTMEAIKGFASIKLNNSYAYEIHRFAGRSDEFSKGRTRLLMSNALMFQSTHFLLLFCSALIWLLGGGSVIAGTLSLGSLVAISEYFLRFVSPLNSMGNANAVYQTNLASMRKIKTLLDFPREDLAMEMQRTDVSGKLVGMLIAPTEEVGPREKLQSIDSLEFDHVFLTWGEGKESTLEDLTFGIRRGQKIGIIGRSGSGKTTLAKMAVGLTTPDRGSVRINGRDLSDWDLLSVRERISYVPQVPFVFSRSIKENIDCGNSASDDVILAMARQHFLADLIDSLDERIYAHVSGQSLSGGEMQKICLMRYILRDSDLYIFDESFSNIDRHASLSIVDALLKRTEMTVILITHDFSLLDRLDAVYLLADRKMSLLADKVSMAEYLQFFSDG